jgi:hypothetical protein
VSPNEPALGTGDEGRIIEAPPQFLNWFKQPFPGSTKNLKTVSGDAAMKISRSILITRFIAASTFVLFVLPPASTVTIEQAR